MPRLEVNNVDKKKMEKNFIERDQLMSLEYCSPFDCKASTDYTGSRRHALMSAYRRVLADEYFHSLIERMEIDVDDLDFFVCGANDEECEEELFINNIVEDDEEYEDYMGPIYDVDIMGEYEGYEPIHTAHGIEFALWGAEGQGYFFSVIVEPDESISPNVWCFNDDSQTAG